MIPDDAPISRETLLEITGAMNEMSMRMKVLQDSGTPFKKGIARWHAKDIARTLGPEAQIELMYLGMTYVAETYRREFGAE